MLDISRSDEWGEMRRTRVWRKIDAESRKLWGAWAGVRIAEQCDYVGMLLRNVTS